VILSNQSVRGLNMRKQTGLTRIDLAVALACIALMLAQAAVLNAGGRERAKREACLANLRMLTAAWQMYADDNANKIVCGDAEEYGDWETSAGNYAPGGIHYREKPWTLNDWTSGLTLAQKKNQLMNGALFPYVKDIDVYKCPSDLAKEARSFSMVDAMNCIVQTSVGSGAILIKNCQQIIRPDERFVFLDHGGFGGITMGGWTCYVTEDKWWDLPPVSHNDGATFSFADGHSEYRKWQDQRTVDFAKSGEVFSDPQPNNQDLNWAQIRCWGRVQ
jgi:prepilin-type processing-associated H-X9-DG protein